MSTKGHTFREISTFLKKNVNEIKFIDKYKGQLDNISNFVFPRPAVFINFGRFEWENQQGGIQKGSGLIRIRTAVENYADSFTGSINQDKALAFFDFNEKVHQALNGLSGTYFGSLVRVSDEDDEEHKNIIATIMEYECTMVDSSADNKKSFVLADPDLEVIHKNKKDFLENITLESSFIVPKI